MKYIILVPDGMSGEPLEELNDRTCMEVANSPNMDMIARKGIVGTVKNVPKGMVPASDVANLSILGYDPQKYYCGRGPLEAANMGISLEDNEVAFRANTITVSDDRLVDYSAGHITSKESKILFQDLSEKMGNGRLKFYSGNSYRNLLVVKCENMDEAEKLAKVKCFPPHDILDKVVSKHMPKNDEIVEIIEKSKTILKSHDINKVRIDLGQNPANMIWLWGQGCKPNMPTFKDAYNITGGIISAVDLIKGIGRVLGLEVVDVPGATGYYDTNYEGKAQAALDVLERNDMVFVHVEAPDEAGHNGDIMAKIKAIENFDSRITGTILDKFSGNTDCRILILPDHPTPVKKRTHTSDPVPFAMAGGGITPDEIAVFSEKSAKVGSMHLAKGSELMTKLLGSEE